MFNVYILPLIVSERLMMTLLCLDIGSELISAEVIQEVVIAQLSHPQK